MRKYIHIAKAVTPVLTEEAANHIAEEYSRLRSQEQMGADLARVSRSMHAPFYKYTGEVIECTHFLRNGRGVYRWPLTCFVAPVKAG